MCIDFRNDYEVISKYIRQRFKDYSELSDIGLGTKGFDISLIHLGYDIEESSWISVVFDRRSNAISDGEWTKIIVPNSLSLGHWSVAWDKAYEEGSNLIITDLAGNRLEFLPDAEEEIITCLLYTSPSPRDRQKSRMPSSA